jgi:hypothetical protein
MDLTSPEKRCIRNDSDGKVLDKLNLPAGLKELLAGHGCTINQLLRMKSGDIADVFGIDQDAARLIVSAIKKEALESNNDIYDTGTT